MAAKLNRVASEAAAPVAIGVVASQSQAEGSQPVAFDPSAGLGEPPPEKVAA